MDHISNLNRILADAQSVTEIGGKVGENFTRLAAAWQAAANPEQDLAERLADRIVAGADQDTIDRGWNAVLLAHAATPIARASALQSLAAALTPALYQELIAHSATNFEKAKKTYNTAAARLVKAMQTVAPDTAPETLVDSPDTLRTWGQIPALAAEVEVALDALVRTTRIAGIPADEPNLIGLALTVPDGIGRRSVWAAWEHREGRAGRWGALHQLGVTIASQSSLEEHHAYRAPMPMQVEHRREGIGWGTYHVDPEEQIERELGEPEQDEVAEPAGVIGG